eukprot:CAMPEP_0119329516 /NCGR_PEP_ID=MMETSP1333-20130426/76059_1 /TAXON_ID=418940 /ORGANISM="Scyphosphaera apsteinii, Strain RCC1455" /LENGTH=212 /DNA_ID=CAMNT_0007338661 /DNA_START=187 /DNA_END=826 /DNA_ORIENTATION=-
MSELARRASHVTAGEEGRRTQHSLTLAMRAQAHRQLRVALKKRGFVADSSPPRAHAEAETRLIVIIVVPPRAVSCWIAAAVAAPRTTSWRVWAIVVATVRAKGALGAVPGRWAAAAAAFSASWAMDASSFATFAEASARSRAAAAICSRFSTSSRNFAAASASSCAWRAASLAAISAAFADSTRSLAKCSAARAWFQPAGGGLDGMTPPNDE